MCKHISPQTYFVLSAKHLPSQIKLIAGEYISSKNMNKRYIFGMFIRILGFEKGSYKILPKKVSMYYLLKS